jgi:hypothetical protein
MTVIHRGRSSGASAAGIKTKRSPIGLRSLEAPSNTSSNHEKIDLAGWSKFAWGSHYVQQGWNHRRGLHPFLFVPQSMISRSHRGTERQGNETGTLIVDRVVALHQELGPGLWRRCTT